MGGFYYNLLWGGVHLYLDFKMEILTVFSILNYFFDLKMEILPVFSILNYFSNLKMEILPVFFHFELLF